MTIHVKKLYDGCVDIKDYERQQCLDDNDTMIIIHDNKKMTLTTRQVKRDVKKISDKVFTNQVAGRPDYRILSYTWKPDD